MVHARSGYAHAEASRYHDVTSSPLNELYRSITKDFADLPAVFTMGEIGGLARLISSRGIYMLAFRKT